MRPCPCLPLDVDVHLTDFGRAFPKNIAVTGVTATPRPKSVQRASRQPSAPSIFNASPLPVTGVPVRLHIEADEKKRDLEKKVDIDGGATVTVEFSLSEVAEGLWRGYVEAGTGDDLPFDDRRYLALSLATPLSVLVVDGDPGRTTFESETYFLQAALRLAPPGERYAKTPFDTRPAELVGAAALPDLEKTDAVVLANVESLSAADARRLAEFVERGGGLVVFTGDRVKAESASALNAAGLGVGDVIGPATATELAWRLERWESGHPILRPLSDPEHGDLRRPAFSAITKIKPAADAHVLAWFRGGEPALLERTHGRGKVLWFASACDRSWSDWPRGRLYVPLVHQMLSYVSGLSEGGRIREETAAGDRRLRVSLSPRDCFTWPTPIPTSRRPRAAPRASSPAATASGFRSPWPRAPWPRHQGADCPTTVYAMEEIWPWLALTLMRLLARGEFSRQPDGGITFSPVGPMKPAKMDLNAKGTTVTLLTIEPKELKFLARFEHVWASLRRYQVRQGLCLSFLAAALGLVVLVVADFMPGHTLGGPCDGPRRGSCIAAISLSAPSGSSARCAGGPNGGQPSRSKASSPSSASGSVPSSSTRGSRRS